jgi:secernin
MCLRLSDRTYFAKNSDRPPGEVQLIEPHGPRSPGGRLRTQYLEIADAGSCRVLGARPMWLWGFEHGVNEHRVAIGNEQVYTVDDAAAAPPALIGMDLVRLALERSTTAEQALDVITSLLAEHGQGGVAADGDEAYFSSFLLADPDGGFVLETSGRTWAARPTQDGAAISNRITTRRNWTFASTDVERGADFDAWRDPAASTGHADDRLAVTLPTVTEPTDPGPAELVSALRDHGHRRWGRPSPAPGADDAVLPDTQRVSVCMHLPGYRATTSAMVAELHGNPSAPQRAWLAPGSPCVSVFVPVFPPDRIPAALSTEATWRRFAALRDQVEAEPASLAEVRSVLAPLEYELWSEGDEVGDDPVAQQRFVDQAWGRVDEAIRSMRNTG